MNLIRNTLAFSFEICQVRQMKFIWIRNPQRAASLFKGHSKDLQKEAGKFLLYIEILNKVVYN
jgi:hypothetical protein